MNCIMIDDSIPKIFNVIIASDLDNDSIDYHQNFVSGLSALKDNFHSKVTPYPQKPFDLLILDMNFPMAPARESTKGCGLLMLKELKRRNISIPTVLYSSDRIDLTEELSSLGVIDIIQPDEQNLKDKLNSIKLKLNQRQVISEYEI